MSTVSSTRWAIWVGRLSDICLAPSSHTLQFLGIVALLLLGRADDPATGLLTPSLMVYVITTALLYLLDVWRDRDLLLLVQRGRQCTHHIGAFGSINPPPQAIGPAFSLVLCGLTACVRGARLIAIGIFAFGTAEASSSTVLVALTSFCGAMLDFLVEIGRGLAISLEREPAYLNGMIGGGAGRFAIRSPHPPWGPWRGHRFFVLEAPVATSADGSVVARHGDSDFGLVELDDGNE